jgi:hypothetical protein
MDWIGRKVKIVRKDHPHYGERGTIVRETMTALGKVGTVIKLYDCVHGVDECFIFNQNEVEFIGRNQ